MLYLLVSLLLIAAAVGLYLRALLQGLPLPRSTQVILAVFLLAGSAMTYFSLQEISPARYQTVETLCNDYPQLRSMVDERRPVIRHYEYLEILEAQKQLQKAAPKGF